MFIIEFRKSKLSHLNLSTGLCTVKTPVFGILNSAISKLSNLICQNCYGSIKILLDVGNQQHPV